MAYNSNTYGWEANQGSEGAIQPEGAAPPAYSASTQANPHAVHPQAQAQPTAPAQPQQPVGLAPGSVLQGQDGALYMYQQNANGQMGLMKLQPIGNINNNNNNNNNNINNNVNPNVNINPNTNPNPNSIGVPLSTDNGSNYQQNNIIPLSTDDGSGAQSQLQSQARVESTIKELKQKTDEAFTETGLNLATGKQHKSKDSKPTASGRDNDKPYVIAELTEDDVYFWSLLWFVLLGFGTFLIVFSANQLPGLECDSNCSTSYYSYSDCYCDPEWDEVGYSCGYDSSGNTVYCEYATDESGLTSFWIFLLVFIPITIVSFACFFLIKKAKLHPAAAIPMGIFASVPATAIFLVFAIPFGFVMGGIFTPFFVAGMNLDGNGGGSGGGKRYRWKYSDFSNSRTHIHVFSTAVHNGDTLFCVGWTIMMIYTVFAIIFCSINMADPYKENDEKGVYTGILIIALLADYLTICASFIFICKMGVAKAMILTIPMMTLMFVFSWPFGIFVFPMMFGIFCCCEKPQPNPNGTTNSNANQNLPCIIQ